MDKGTWTSEYKRLLTAYNRQPNAEQAGVYFAALAGYPSAFIKAAVDAAIRESKTWPSVADLAERARNVRAGANVPRGHCDVCHDEGWTIHPCAGVSAETPTAQPRPVDRQAWCGRTYVHVDHGYARRCYQCRPFQSRDGAA